ncbi:MAG: aminotransferase class I/II-fold pyridoxal phosphate-dependent enzyme [Candidatus Lokiarchaeota archaeon]|nr:aminotransferase class I/II-fold pyridoxal phosphate-dependent enzyme [Candidatus Lokiarchaeota archaeon]MBD3341412.1 aminotransferase class I/II-fold pyridoxal phosphate-dependent enzyme [Candidatus Lokiarchaeota archaeon]
MKYAERMKKLGTETAFEVLQKIQNFPEDRRKNVISFAIGEPDFSTPEHIKNAGIEAIKENYTHYTPSSGMLELRKAIAEYVTKSKLINISYKNIIVLPSAKYIVDLTILSCTNPGDQVIYPNPGYPIYESLINVHGCEPVPARLWESKEWNYDLEQFRSLVTEKTKLIIINSPQNPTGSVLDQKNLEMISELALEYDIWVFSDEIYSKIVYDDNHYKSIAAHPDMLERTIILDGFSKFFAMTGWRIGYAIVNETLAEYFTRWATNTISCTAAFTQKASLTAMEEDKTPSLAMVDEFMRRRDLICKRIEEINGISAIKPKGAFYVFANITEACEKLGLKTSIEFQNYILDKTDVAVLSRNYFGNKFPDEEDLYVRFSYCVSNDDIEEGMNRIEKLLSS